MDRRGFVELALATALAPSVAPRPKGLPKPNDVQTAKAPYAVVLGSVQDAGLPQVGCYSERCDRARDGHAAGSGRYTASMALVGPSAEAFFLVDATPDITRQIDLVQEPVFRDRARMRDPFDGIFLTHAHVGHYLGLALLGNEGLGVSDLPIFCTASMARFLEANDPWAYMVRQRRIVPTPLAAERWHRIDDWLEARLLPVPHRDELSDTVGFLFRGPSALLLYLPDIDSWSAWASWNGPQRDVREVVASVDVALLDGTFWSAEEVPGRAVEDIPHPLLTDSMERLQAVLDSGTTRIVFTHLNNSNPALDEVGPERTELVGRGFEVAREGDRYVL